MSQTIAERVQRGIDLLDAKGPADWRERINGKTLDVKTFCCCVLGQVFGDFCDGKLALGMAEHSLPYGFCPEDRAEAELLNAEWVRRISEVLTERLVP